MAASLDAQKGRSTTSELLIDDRHEAIGRPRLASRPRTQQGCDFYTVSHLQNIVSQNGGGSPDFSRL
jgi:hypothetical protein